MSKDLPELIKTRWNRNRKPEYRVNTIEELAESLKREDSPVINWFFSELTIQEIILFAARTRINTEHLKRLYFSNINYQRSELLDYFFGELVPGFPGTLTEKLKTSSHQQHGEKVWGRQLIPIMKLVSQWLEESIGPGNYALGGGTALSLFYLNHRNSGDLGFFLRFEEPVLRRVLASRTGRTSLSRIIAETGRFEVRNIRFPGYYLSFEIVNLKHPERPVKTQVFETVHIFEPVHRDDFGFPLFVDRPEQIVFEKLRWRFDRPAPRDLFDIAVCSLAEPDLWKNLMDAEEFCIDLIVQILKFVESNEQWKKDYKDELSRLDINSKFLSLANVDAALQIVKEHVAKAICGRNYLNLPVL